MRTSFSFEWLSVVQASHAFRGLTVNSSFARHYSMESMSRNRNACGIEYVFSCLSMDMLMQENLTFLGK